MSIIGLLKKSSTTPLMHPAVFFLDVKKNFEAQWLPVTELNSLEIAWQTRVNWPELNSEIVIATNLNLKLNLNLTLNLNEEDYHNISYLKSHLQKCIRRSNTYKALKTAWHMCKLDQQELLRRLAVITLEDVLPLNGFSTLIWLTSAVSKGYILSDMHYYWILGYVYDLCQCKYFDVNLTQEENILDFKSLKLRSLCQPGRNLCYSIVFRHSYGGTKTDKNMYLKSAEIWAGRFRVKSEFLELLSRDVKFITSPSDALHKDEWILAAIDFHPYPGIILNIAEKHDQFTHDQIKKAIWYCSSSITNKHNISSGVKIELNDHDIVKVWNVIKRDFLSLAKFMIMKNA